MHRRSLLQSIVATAAGARVFAIGELEDLRAARKSNRVGEKGRSSKFVETADGTSLFFRDWGKGKAVVFVAPWALHSDWWEYQTADLAGHGLRCIGYDRRGHGRSGQPGQGYDFDTLSDDLAALIEQLELRDIMLVGQSMGCGEVVRYLSRHGATRVARVVMVSTITPFLLKTEDNPDGVDKAALEAVRKTLSKDRPHPIAAAAPAFFGAPKNAVSTEIVEWWVRMMVDGCSLKTMLDLHRMFTETDFRPELRTISVPTLLIHGDNDASTPIDLTARKTVPLIRGCQLKVYESAAHGLPITHADRLNADLLAFVNG